MRVLFLALLAVLPAASTFALPISAGKIVRGNYYASGHVSVAGITVTYPRSLVHVNAHGRVKGYVSRIVTSRGALLETGYASIRGSLQTLRIRHGIFTSVTVLRLGDSAKITGTFRGLVDPSGRLSRYFKGEISGSTKSNFVLRAR